jgi:hypothetical protein
MAGLKPLAESRVAHETWWRDFWRRSWIFATDTGPDTGAEDVTRGYVLQRYITACAGRGALPIKFNGSLFTVPTPTGWGGDPDYRRWGSGYWWQNTRLPYISLCTTGDFELFEPLFRMYAGPTLDLAQYRTRHHLGQPGAFLNECSYFWGAAFNDIYGWSRPDDLPPGINREGWHRWEFTAGYELAFMMFDYYEHTRDESFLKTTLLPFTREVLTFYDSRYPIDPAGKIVIHPAQSLETWWDCTNPMPDIAGLTSVTDRVLGLPEALVPAEDRALARRLREKMPPLPTREDNGARILAAAERYADKRNIENPELYAIFPFGLVGLGRPGLEQGIEAFQRRAERGFEGWRPDDLIAARLGLVETARTGLVQRARSKHAESRFPAFWGPNFDWVPDQDHGGVLMKTFQSMLIQTNGAAIHLMPAWPAGWDAEFRVHAPGRSTLEGTIRGGKLTRLSVSPKERRADVVPPIGQTLP